MNIDERAAVATQFGVSAEQVERDHLISYVLAFLSSSVGDQVQFIGGTALARTHLAAGRLSEDIDLIAIGDRKSVAATLDSDLPRALSRSHGRLILDPKLGNVASTQPAPFDRRAACPCEFNCSPRTTEWCGHPSGASWFSATPTPPQPSCLFRHCPPLPRRRPRPGPIGAALATYEIFGRSATSAQSTAMP